MAVQYTQMRGYDKNTRKKFLDSWRNMKKRCDNPFAPYYENYGGRGIKVCEEWYKFENYFDDMFDSFIVHNSEYGGQNTSIDRIDSSKGYNKDNCKWATATEQARNTRQNHFFEYNNIKATLAEWSERIGVKRSTLAQRIYVYKWDLGRALAQ